MNRFTVAQIRDESSTAGNNIRKHCEAIKIAIGLKADYILFPELSITGYLREGVESSAFPADNASFNEIRTLSEQGGIAVSAGIPLRIGGDIYISSVTFLPAGTYEIYTKKNLHPGEEQYYRSSREYDPVIKIGDDRIVNAICYDIEIEDHITSAMAGKPTIYSAGIFYSRKGIEGGCRRLEAIARENAIHVLMANYTGTCWNTPSGGMSAIWDSAGNTMIQADQDEECLLVGEKTGSRWKCSKVRIY